MNAASIAMLSLKEYLHYLRLKWRTLGASREPLKQYLKNGIEMWKDARQDFWGIPRSFQCAFFHHDLFKLAGMKFRQGYFSPEQWVEYAGVDPRRFPDYVEIRGGVCLWTNKAELLYQSHIRQSQQNWTSLGIAAQ